MCCARLTFTPQAITNVYDGLADLPLDEVTYETVLKPLIDLDFESQSKNSWLDVSNGIGEKILLSSVLLQCCPGCRHQRDCK